MKRRLLWFVVSVVAFAAIIVAVMRRDAEPIHLGHPLSYWVEPLSPNDTETPQSVSAAYATMDQRHVRWLERQLQWRPSKLRLTVAKVVNSIFGSAMSVQAPGDRRRLAAEALGRLGDRALPAIPALRRMKETVREQQDHGERSAALAALIQLGAEPLGAHLEAIRNPSLTNWYQEADALVRLGTNAVGAAEIFEALFSPTNPPGIRIPASLFYLRVEPDATRAVLVMTKALESPVTRLHGLSALSMLHTLHTNAATAAEAVAGCLEDTNWSIRHAATNTLRQIAPTVALRFGVR